MIPLIAGCTRRERDRHSRHVILCRKACDEQRSKLPRRISRKACHALGGYSAVGAGTADSWHCTPLVGIRWLCRFAGHAGAHPACIGHRAVSQQEETFESDENADDTLSPEDVIWNGADTSVMQDKDIVNLLLIGQDRREGQDRQRADSMIMVTLNKKTKQISMTSFMRDLYVQIPGYSDNRINATYAFGGMDLLDSTLNTNFGVEIAGNVEVDFGEFQTLIDSIGGIDLELTQDEADYICGRKRDVTYPQQLRTDWNLHEGVNHLTGEQALIHARNRSLGNDYARTDRSVLC